MTYHKGRSTVTVFVNGSLTKRTRIPNRPSNRNEVGVGNPNILTAENGVEMFENLSANEFIIPINNHVDFIGLAEVVCSPVQIGHGHFSLLVDDNGDFFIRDIMLFDVFLNKVASIIFRSIVNKDDSVVRVILLDD